MNNQSKTTKGQAQPETRKNYDWGCDPKYVSAARGEPAQQPQPETRTDYLPDDGPDGFELPDGTETWEGSYPVQQPQHSPEIGRNHPEGTTTILNLDLWHLEKRANHADKLAEALTWIKEVVSERKGTAMWAQMLEDKARNALREYQNAKGGE